MAMTIYASQTSRHGQQVFDGDLFFVFIQIGDGFIRKKRQNRLVNVFDVFFFYSDTD